MLKKKYEKYCQLFVKYGVKRQAYEEAYGCKKSTAKVQSWKLHKKPEIKARIDEIMGASNKTQVEHVIDLITRDLEAHKEVVYNNKGEIVEVRDNQARQKAQEYILKLNKVEGFSKSSIVDNRTQVVNIGIDDVKKLDKVLGELKLLNQKMVEGECLQSGEVIDV